VNHEDHGVGSNRPHDFTKIFGQQLFSSILLLLFCLFRPKASSKEGKKHGQCEYTEDNSQADRGGHLYMRNVQVQTYGCTQTIDILVHSKQHLDADKNKDDTKSVLQILEVFGHSCQRKVEGSEPEDGKDVGGKDNERVTTDAEYGRDAIYGKGDIGGLDDQQGYEWSAGCSSQTTCP